MKICIKEQQNTKRTFAHSFVFITELFSGVVVGIVILLGLGTPHGYQQS